MIIQISTANSRLSKTWRGEQLTWDAFCERLREPRRGTETLADYMKLTKAQQDDLKDVGGFVGGTFTAQDRKLIHLKERSLITLDLDTIPKLGTEDVLRKIESLHLAAVVYSTRKHSARGPRLRVLLPFAEPEGLPSRALVFLIRRKWISALCLTGRFLHFVKEKYPQLLAEFTS